MRRLAKTVAALSLLSIMGVAAWALAQSAAKDDKAATLELMRIVVPKSAYDAMLDQMYTQMTATMQQMGKPFPAAKQKAMKEAVQESLPYDEFLKSSTEVYMKHLTRKEIDDLATFCKTPTGRKVAAILPTLSGEVGAKMAPVLATRLPAAMKKRGLE